MFSKKMKKVLACALTVSMSCSMLTTATAAEEEKVIRVASVYDFKSATEGKTLVYETLVQSDMAGNFSGLLAESYEISEDGMLYTFHLREGVKYHDGCEFNAETAKFSLDYIAANTVLGNYIGEVNIVDDYTVEIVMKNYFANLLYSLSEVANAMICEHDLDEEGLKTGFIGTGAYVFSEDAYEKSVKATLTSFDEYWGGKPAIDKVEVLNITDPNAMVVALESDEVDVIGIAEHHSSIPYVQISALKAAGFTVETDDTGRVQVLEYNCNKAPFNDVNVRMAFDIAVDKNLMVETLFEGLTTAADVITAPWYVNGPTSVAEDYYAYDFDRAIRLLEESGWVDEDGDGIREKDGETLTLDLISPNGEANADSVCVYLQSELKKIGAEVNVLNLEGSAASELKSSGEFDMYVHHSFCLPNFPGGIDIGGKYHSSNTSWPDSFHSEELDEMINAAFTNSNAEESAEQIQKIWQYLHEQAPCMPLYYILKLVAMNPRVSGYHVGSNMFDISMIKDMDIDMSM